MTPLKLCYTILLATLLASCKLNCSVGEDRSGVKTKTVSSADNTPLTGAIIKNDIELEATGVKVKEAYLLDADENLLTENITRAGEKIHVVIKADTGWTKENGRSFIGVAERISTSEGEVVLDAADIFKDYETTGIDADDSKVISVSAVITKPVPGKENFVVQFRVWDKKGAGEIKGKYKFSLAK
jgi:hypothetical protein